MYLYIHFYSDSTEPMFFRYYNNVKIWKCMQHYFSIILINDHIMIDSYDIFINTFSEIIEILTELL